MKVKIILILSFFLAICGKNPIFGEETNEEEVIVEEEITVPSDSIEIFYPDYEPWEKVSLQGKLKMQGLPLSPTVKIFMERDSLISMSVRAPFIGEAGRIDITPDSVLMVNKMNKTYVKERIADFLKYYPGGLKDMQDLLLGRFFLPGINISEVDLDDYVDIYYEEEQINVVPKEKAKIDGVKFGFVVDNLFNPLMLIVMPQNGRDTEIAAIYNYQLKGYDIRFVYEEGSQIIEAVLELKEPDWKGGFPGMPDIGKKFRQVGINEFLHGMGM